MNMIFKDPSNLIPLFVILPLGGAFLISFLGKRSKRFCDIFANLISALLLIISAVSIAIVKTSGPLIYKLGHWPPPIGITLVLDGMTLFMLLTTNIISFFIMLYSVNYMERYTDNTKHKSYSYDGI